MAFFKKKIWLKFLIVLVLVVICAYLTRGGNNPVSKTINAVITPIETRLLKITHPVGDFFSYMAEMKDYRKKNEELKAENISLMGKMSDVSELTEENERLKKLLGIADEIAESQKVAARVVAYEPDNWFSYITINKGSSSGIKLSDPVMTADGVLGQVCEVGKNWARISTIINNDSAIGVRIVRNGEIGIVEGDIKLSRTNKCRLGYLVENASVIAGDILETSGLGGIYPPGLPVGKISEISKDNMGRLDYAVIEPFADFNKLYEVLVITEWSLDEGAFFDAPDYPDEYSVQNGQENAEEQTEDYDEEEAPAEHSVG